MKHLKNRKFLFVLLCVLLAACNPSKVTDPSDPRFDPTKFSFSDYPRDEQLASALKKILKPNMEREVVEKLLVDAGNAQVVEAVRDNFGGYLNKDKYFQSLKEKHPRIITYQKGGPRKTSAGWLLHVFYNEQNELIQIFVRRLPVLDEK